MMLVTRQKVLAGVGYFNSEVFSGVVFGKCLWACGNNSKCRDSASLLAR